MDKDNYTSTGFKKAGAGLPDEVGAGGRANIRPSNIAEDLRQTDQRIMHIKRLSAAIGYNPVDDDKLKQSKAEITKRLRIKDMYRDRKSLAMWMKAMRDDYAENNIELMKDSFGSNLEEFVEKIALDKGVSKISCRVYPVFLYKEVGFPGVIDMVVDVDFDNENQYAEPTFRTFKILMSDDPVETFIQHDSLSKQGVNYTVRVPKNNTQDYVKQLKFVAETILTDAKEIYDKVHENYNYADTIRRAQEGADGITITRF